MSNNRNQKLTALVSDDLADVAAAQQAMDVIWARLVEWTGKPYVSKDDVDSMSDELRRVEAGLRTTRKYLLRVLEDGVENAKAQNFGREQNIKGDLTGGIKCGAEFIS